MQQCIHSSISRRFKLNQPFSIAFPSLYVSNRPYPRKKTISPTPPLPQHCSNKGIKRFNRITLGITGSPPYPTWYANCPSSHPPNYLRDRFPCEAESRCRPVTKLPCIIRVEMCLDRHDRRSCKTFCHLCKFFLKTMQFLA